MGIITELKEIAKIWGVNSPLFNAKCEEIKNEVGRFEFVKIYNKVVK